MTVSLMFQLNREQDKYFFKSVDDSHISHWYTDLSTIHKFLKDGDIPILLHPSVPYKVEVQKTSKFVYCRLKFFGHDLIIKVQRKTLTAFCRKMAQKDVSAAIEVEMEDLSILHLDPFGVGWGGYYSEMAREWFGLLKGGNK